MSWSILWKTLLYIMSGESENISTIHMFCRFPYIWNLHQGHLLSPPHALMYCWEMARVIFLVPFLPLSLSYPRKRAVQQSIHIYWASLLCWLLWNTRTWKIQWPGPGKELIIPCWENQTHDQLLPRDSGRWHGNHQLGSATVAQGREQEVWTAARCAGFQEEGEPGWRSSAQSVVWMAVGGRRESTGILFR